MRTRIARQITDADRIEAADVVFNNDGTPEELRNEVLAWWNEYKKTVSARSSDGNSARAIPGPCFSF